MNRDLLVKLVQAHPYWFTIILFVLSAVISVYSQEVKRFLHSWPRTRRMGRAFARNTAKNRLDLLNQVHHDSYQLCLYVFSTLGAMVFIAIIWNVLFFVFIVVITRRMPTAWPFWSIATGIWVGKLMQMNSVFLDLYRYDYVSEKLKGEIARYSDVTVNQVMDPNEHGVP